MRSRTARGVAGQQRSRWWSYAAGVVVGGCVLAGCGGPDIDGTEVVIVDPAGRLSDSAADELRQIELPDRTALVIAVADARTERLTGAGADRLAGDLVDECANEDRCAARGIFVIVDEGSYPMMRVGDEFALRAAWRGATYGNRYVAAQHDAALLPLDEQALMFTEYAVAATLEATASGLWLERLDGWSTTFGYGPLITDYMTTSLPDGDGGSVYERLFVKPLTGLQHFERDITGTWWVSAMAGSAALYLVTRWLGRLLLARTTGLWTGVAAAVAVSAFWVATALLAVPISAAFIVQSGARLEDYNDVRDAFGPLPALDLAQVAWAPAHSWLLSFAILIAGVATGAANLVHSWAWRSYVEEADVAALSNAGAINELQEALLDSSDTDASTDLGGQVIKAVAVPLVLAVAAYSVLPTAMVAAGLIAVLASLPLRVVDAIRSRNNGIMMAAAGRQLRGVPPPPERTIRLDSWRAATMKAAGLAACGALVFAFDGSPTAPQVANAQHAPATSTATTSTAAPAPSASSAPPATPAPAVAFDPAQGVWGDWPNAAKPDIGAFAAGDAVAYLQGVLILRAGQTDVSVTGVFDGHTVDGVEAVQTYTQLPVTGQVDTATWAVIDLLAASP